MLQSQSCDIQTKRILGEGYQLANRNFNRFQALEKEVKSLYAEVSIGGTGAPTIVTALGIASVSRTGVGRYTVTLDDKYSRLMHAQASLVTAINQDLVIHVAGSAVDSAKTVRFRCLAAGVAADPASGDSLLIRIDLKNSSV